jgi:hypothetical protein
LSDFVDFVQCDVRQLYAYKNQTDGLAKSVIQQKSDLFWLFHVNDPLMILKISEIFTERVLPEEFRRESENGNPSDEEEISLFDDWANSLVSRTSLH